jgi:small membrane protein
MIIRVLLLLGLAASGWFIFLKRNRLPFHIVTLFALLGVGAVAVVVPETTNEIALLVGVGRGADLVMYVAIVSVLFVLIHYYAKFVDLQHKVTQLTRELAILRAETEASAKTATTTSQSD